MAAAEEKPDINRHNGGTDTILEADKGGDMLGIRWSLSFHHETKCLSLFRAVFQMGSLVETVRHPPDRVSGDFKQKWRLPLPIFVCVCKDLQELVTIYRTAVKTACVRGCLKESDMKEFVIAWRLMLKKTPKYRKKDSFRIKITIGVT